jgi:hypothetical protein
MRQVGIFNCNAWPGQLKDIHKILRFLNQLPGPDKKEAPGTLRFIDKLIFNK